MAADPNKKSSRNFMCRDYLWETFERMGQDLDCSVDYLVNEAMRQYARARKYTEKLGPTPGTSSTTQHNTSVMHNKQVEAMRARVKTPPPLPPRPQTPLAAPASAVQPSSNLPTIYVVFNGQKHLIDKDEFIIGRGSRSADLPIRDGNISRRHAAVVYEDEAFWIKDLGSTNGVEYAGQLVSKKRIEEGDVIQICDYEIGFTYN